MGCARSVIKSRNASERLSGDELDKHRTRKRLSENSWEHTRDLAAHFLPEIGGRVPGRLAGVTACRAKHLAAVPLPAVATRGSILANLTNFVVTVDTSAYFTVES